MSFYLRNLSAIACALQRGAAGAMCAALLATCDAAYSQALEGQPFPHKPLRLLVGQGAYTATDIVARLVAARWSELLGKPVVVDNRPGAAETIAAATVARATPDGYTNLFGSIASHGIAPAIYRNLPYDPARDFAPISLVGKVPNVLIVHPGLPVRTLGEFAAHIKKNPGQLNYASTGVGTSTHLGMELLKGRLGLDIVHVPYKSGSAAFSDVIAGHVAAGLFNLPSQLQFIKAGKVRALGVSSPKPSVQLPEVPTIASSVPGYELIVWYAVFAPAATPTRIRAQLYTSLVETIRAAELRRKLIDEGVEPVASTPAELAEYSRAEIRKWTKVAAEAGVKVE